MKRICPIRHKMKGHQILRACYWLKYPDIIIVTFGVLRSVGCNSLIWRLLCVMVENSIWDVLILWGEELGVWFWSIVLMTWSFILILLCWSINICNYWVCLNHEADDMTTPPLPENPLHIDVCRKWCRLWQVSVISLQVTDEQSEKSWRDRLIFSLKKHLVGGWV